MSEEGIRSMFNEIDELRSEISRLKEERQAIWDAARERRCTNLDGDPQRVFTWESLEQWEVQRFVNGAPYTIINEPAEELPEYLEEHINNSPNAFTEIGAVRAWMCKRDALLLKACRDEIVKAIEEHEEKFEHRRE